MSFGFFRGIWISLRATNYTNAAFHEVAQNILKLDKAQLQLIRRSKMMTQVGLMFIAMGSMVGMAIMGIIEKSRFGARIMSQFGRRMDKVLGRLGDTLATIVAPALETIVTFLEFIGENPALNLLASVMLIVVASALLLGGVFIILMGFMSSLSVNVGAFTALLVKMGIITDITAAKVSILTIQVVKFGLALGLALGAFSILMMVGQYLPPVAGAIIAAIVAITAALWALYIAESAATLGFAVAIGAAGAAAAMAVQAANQPNIPAYQMGTSFVKQGGLAVLHGGERIKSARETTALSKIEKDRMGGKATRISNYIPITIGEVHTKADKDTLYREIKKALREGLSQKV